MMFLVRIALIHYQFATIHPFLDGNGRVGRSVFLKKQPMLQETEFFHMRNTSVFCERIHRS
ncbi:MAG: Fic family protein [Lachnospiraceae bacterium]|nr:Fic family protein [Lachnospiraceae bacterium]